MKKINLGISGCMGRMGQQLIRSSKKNNSFYLKTLTENRTIDKRIYGIKPEFNTEDAFKKVDVIIDFTIPKCTLEVLKIASKLKKKVVIGTTGFSRSQESQIKKYSKRIPILKAGNMSLGVNLLMYLTEIASKSLNDDYLSKISEVHHKHKKDYPSGTALMLGKGIADGKNKNLYNLIGKKFLNKNIILVEVGVGNGGSLFMWRNFFGKKAKIIGIELNPDAIKLEKYGFKIFIGDQSDPNFWKNFYTKWINSNSNTPNIN